MTLFAKEDWLVPAGLIALSFIPVVAGTFWITLLGGADVTPDGARFFAASWPVVLHIAGAVVYCVFGAFQFFSSFHRRRPGWHRAAGQILVPAGLVAALAVLWMTQFYPHGIEPPAVFGRPSLDVIRFVAGSAMAVSLGLGFAAIRRRDIPHHRTWMMRAYALGLGAGTQALTHLPW